MRPRRGMTLLEVLIALGLLLALLGALFGFFFNAIDSRERVLELTAQHRAASAVIERLERDLVFTLVGDAHFGAGLVGDETSIRVLTRGVAVHLAEQGTNDPGPFLDLQRTEYRFSLARGIEARRSNADDALNGAAFESLDASIYRVQFRYHDGSDWRDSYDSLDAGALPVAVEVAVWFRPWPGAEDAELTNDATPNEDSVERERLTFEPTGTFDEDEWARRSDRDMFAEQLPPPDRVRVILIPDAREEDDDAEA